MKLLNGFEAMTLALEEYSKLLNVGVGEAKDILLAEVEPQERDKVMQVISNEVETQSFPDYRKAVKAALLIGLTLGRVLERRSQEGKDWAAS